MSLVTSTEPKQPISKFSRKAFFSYSPGEESFQLGYLGAGKSILSGVLHIRYTDEKPIFARKVKVSFVGKEYTFFRGTLDESQNNSDDEDDIFHDNKDNDNPSDTISTLTAKRRIFGTSVCLWRSQRKGSYEGVKSLDLPFRFKLPSNLPPSVNMDRGCGRIYYTLKAEISRKPLDPDSHVHEKMIKLLVPICRYTITPPPNPFKWIASEEGPAKSRIVGYEVALSHATFGPGGTITVPIKLQLNEPQVYLKKIMVGIKEYRELRTNQYETSIKKYITQESISEDSIPITNDPDKIISVEVKLKIPNARKLVYDLETTYLTVMHKLKVKIRLGRAPDIHLSRPITIENIVTHEEVFPPVPKQVEVPGVVKHAKQQRLTPIEVKSPAKKNKRSSPFFPFFSKIRALDPVTQKRISMIQLLQIVDSKNPHVVYNSRSLVVT